MMAQEGVHNAADPCPVSGEFSRRRDQAGGREWQEHPPRRRRVGDCPGVAAALGAASQGRCRPWPTGSADDGGARGVAPAPAREQDLADGARHLKKSRGLLREGDAVSRFRFIDAEKAAYPLTRLCRSVGVSRAGYYAWTHRPRSQRSQDDAALKETIRSIHAKSRQTYGSPRVHAALCAQGTRVSRKRVVRLMRCAGLRGCRVRRTLRTTVQDPAATPAPNLVQRQFDVGELDRVWVTDITYLPTNEGWLYLAAMLDGCSRRVVGWAMADHLRTDLAL